MRVCSQFFSVSCWHYYHFMLWLWLLCVYYYHINCAAASLFMFFIPLLFSATYFSFSVCVCDFMNCCLIFEFDWYLRYLKTVARQFKISFLKFCLLTFFLCISSSFVFVCWTVFINISETVILSAENMHKPVFTTQSHMNMHTKNYTPAIHPATPRCTYMNWSCNFMCLNTWVQLHMHTLHFTG